jgi:hypothetical protein
MTSSPSLPRLHEAQMSGRHDRQTLRGGGTEGRGVVSPGGTGLSGLREDHQVGTHRTTIHSSRDAALAGLLLLAG